ncbi:MAG: SemiSWEET transporter [Nanoarchaeota archaeon]|nr:SemiSWEET transporter [Nanoarchaeota archaeon]MBU1704057.1 SemiSWEET transporter [Nanoarchaeota archaeon]
METVTIIGLAAGTLTTASFLPQFVKVLKTKETGDLSLFMYVAFVFGIILWLIYGIILNALPIILANAVSLALAFSILILKIKYG